MEEVLRSNGVKIVLVGPVAGGVVKRDTFELTSVVLRAGWNKWIWKIGNMDVCLFCKMG